MSTEIKTYLDNYSKSLTYDSDDEFDHDDRNDTCFDYSFYFERDINENDEPIKKYDPNDDISDSCLKEVTWDQYDSDSDEVSNKLQKKYLTGK